ncbi:hypothetical protein HNQ79_004722, partial [Streptomyces candidus]|nr:hypothetical protein [Streptomyces candidus]
RLGRALGGGPLGGGGGGAGGGGGGPRARGGGGGGRGGPPPTPAFPARPFVHYGAPRGPLSIGEGASFEVSDEAVLGASALGGLPFTVGWTVMVRRLRETDRRARPRG